MAGDDRRRGVRRSTQLQRSEGLIAAFQVVMADTFFSTPETPCRREDVRDAVADSLGYDQEARRKLKHRWSQWLRGLPKSSGRLTPNEITALRTSLGYRTGLPEELLAKLTRIVPDAIFWALCDAFAMTPKTIAELRHHFCDGEPLYQIFRYSIGEPGRIAVGHLWIGADKKSGAIKTTEQYKIKREPHKYSGYFLKQIDGAYRIFANHEGTGQIQVMQFRGMIPYANNSALAGKARRMVGAFLDRHDGAYFYTGKVVVQRVGRSHAQLPLGTMSEKELSSYDSTIFDDLTFERERVHEHLFTFRV